ncbi:hypothetical protein FORC065_0902 [Yersinia enterocolitica]|nr:hypothetical protein FORC065_0902 [Yersinia enterocolitica]
MHNAVRFINNRQLKIVLIQHRRSKVIIYRGVYNAKQNTRRQTNLTLFMAKLKNVGYCIIIKQMKSITFGHVRSFI